MNAIHRVPNGQIKVRKDLKKNTHQMDPLTTINQPLILPIKNDNNVPRQMVLVDASILQNMMSKIEELTRLQHESLKEIKSTKEKVERLEEIIKSKDVDIVDGKPENVEVSKPPLTIYDFNIPLRTKEDLENCEVFISSKENYDALMTSLTAKTAHITNKRRKIKYLLSDRIFIIVSFSNAAESRVKRMNAKNLLLFSNFLPEFLGLECGEYFDIFMARESKNAKRRGENKMQSTSKINYHVGKFNHSSEPNLENVEFINIENGVMEYSDDED